ncbi:hypothetical protein Tco_0930696 [Tanacetum coccineum]
MGDVIFKQLMDEYDDMDQHEEEPANDDDQITFLGTKYDDMDQREEEPADSDLHSKPDDDVQSISGFEATNSNKEDTADNTLDVRKNLNASANKPSNLLGHLLAEVSFLSNKVKNLESSLADKVSSKLEESVPRLVADAFEKRMPELIFDSLKNILPQLIEDSL